MFLGKLSFEGKNMHFIQKQKLFQKLGAIVKQKKKLHFQNYYLWGVLGVHE